MQSKFKKAIHKCIAEVWLFFFLALTITPIFSQGNYRIENFGNRSVLLSGVVTGSVEDLGLTYYNPSRLALVENTGFTINAQSYQIDQVQLENALGNSETQNSSKFQGKPSMVAGTFKLKFLEDHYFAYSYISKSRLKTNLDFRTESGGGGVLQDIERSIGEVRLNNVLDDDWYGLTWAKSLADNFSIGVSAFLSIYKYEGNNFLSYASLSDDSAVSQYEEKVGFYQESYGLFWKVGLAYSTEKIDLGLNFSLPYIEIVGAGSFYYSEFSAGFEGIDDIFTSQNFEDIESKRKEPFSVAFGMGIPIGKSKIHMNVEWYNGIQAYDVLKIPEVDSDTEEPVVFQFKDEYRSIVNFGIGAEIYLSSRVNLYGSFSSDYSPYNLNANIFDVIDEDQKDVNLRIDYFHLGYGVSMKFKNVNMVLGGNYTSGDSSFKRPINLPSDQPVGFENESANIKLSRWGFLVGLEIPVFGVNIK